LYKTDLNMKAVNNSNMLKINHNPDNDKLLPSPVSLHFLQTSWDSVINLLLLQIIVNF